MPSLHQDQIKILKKRLKNLIDDYGTVNKQIDIELDEVKRNRLKRQSESLEQEIKQVESKLDSLQSKNDPNMAPEIDNPKNLDLPDEVIQVLAELFAGYQRVVIKRVFAQSLAGGWVIEVDPVKDGDKAELPAVVKLAALSLIEQEWRAYQKHIHHRLPEIAEIKKMIVLPEIGRGALLYPLAGRENAVINLDEYGNRAGGDTINIGDISGQGIAIGCGAQVTGSRGLDGDEIPRLFEASYHLIDARPPDPEVEKEELIEIINKIRQEVTKSTQANPNKIGRWLNNLFEIAPDIFQAAKTNLLQPTPGISPAIRQIAAQTGADTTTIKG